MNRRLIALFLALCMTLSAAPVIAGAASGQQVSANAVTVTAGNTVTVTLRAENFENIAALDVYAYYDAEILTLRSTSNGSMLTGAQSSVNTKEAGSVTLSLMSLDGISGSGNLLSLQFATKSDCTPGTYPVTIAIGRAHSTDLSAVTVGSANGSVTVNKPTETETFSLSYNVNRSTLQKDDVLTYRVYNSGSRRFVSGDFTVTYDHTVFAFDSLNLSSAMSAEGAVYSVNSSILGQVRLTYAASEAVNAYEMFSVTFQVIADQDSTTTLKTQASNIYRENLSAYLPGSTSCTLTLKKAPEVIDYPNAFFVTDELVVSQESSSVFFLEAGAGVAAADFALRYDPTALKCLSVTAHESLDALGGMVVINDNFEAGTIRFSYINMEGYAETDVPVVRINWMPLRSKENHYRITSTAVGVVDTNQNAVTLEHVVGSGCVFVRQVIAPTCTMDGRTNFACACGESYDIDPVDMLGHNLVKETYCTGSGTASFDACTRCDYSSFEGDHDAVHSYVNHEAKEPTCTEIGWYAYRACINCEYSTYVELPALGHRLILSTSVTVDPLSVTNQGNIPFVLDHDTYYSANHNHNSSSEFTITALYDCELTLEYGVSSENNYDKLHIIRNGTTLASYSGTTSGKRTCTLEAGDVVTVRYTKDGSQNSGDDRGWVKLVYDYVTVGEDVFQPIESLNKDCTEQVVCDVCKQIANEAMEHDYVNHEGKAPTCTQIGWDAYQTCSRCDYSTYVEKPALDHDYIDHKAQAPTCTQIGWEAYQTCSRCDYSTYVEQPATGHNFVADSCTVCGAPKSPLGDLDGNGVVDVDDVVALLLHVSMPDMFPINGEADFDKNGVVDVDDVVTLLLHVSMPDVFPLG